MPAVAGALLAGGRSQRFRGDKLRLRLPGEDRDLAVRAAASLRDSGVSPCWWLATEEPVLLPPSFSLLIDAGEGPKAALAAALAAAVQAGVEAVLLVAADLPLIRARHLGRLLHAWQSSAEREMPLCAADADGKAQPVCAIYPAAMLALVEQQLAEGDRALFSLLEQGQNSVSAPPEVTVPVTDAEGGRDTIHPCFNLNQVQDWEQLLEWSKEGKLS